MEKVDKIPCPVPLASILLKNWQNLYTHTVKYFMYNIHESKNNGHEQKIAYSWQDNYIVGWINSVLKIILRVKTLEIEWEKYTSQNFFLFFS